MSRTISLSEHHDAAIREWKADQWHRRKANAVALVAMTVVVLSGFGLSWLIVAYL